MSTVTLTIPVSGNPFATFDIVLNGVNYTMQFNYNFRFGFWSFTLSSNAVVLFDDVKVVQGFDLGSEYKNINLGGRFFVQSLSGDDADPTLNDFGVGQDKQLLYQYESS